MPELCRYFSWLGLPGYCHHVILFMVVVMGFEYVPGQKILAAARPSSASKKITWMEEPQSAYSIFDQCLYLLSMSSLIRLQHITSWRRLIRLLCASVFRRPI